MRPIKTDLVTHRHLAIVDDFSIDVVRIIPTFGVTDYEKLDREWLSLLLVQLGEHGKDVISKPLQIIVVSSLQSSRSEKNPVDRRDDQGRHGPSDHAQDLKVWQLGYGILDHVSNTIIL